MSAHVSDCCLERFLLGNLAEQESSTIRSHLDVCGTCSDLLVETLAVLSRKAAVSMARPTYSDRGRRHEPGVRANEAALLLEIHPLAEDHVAVHIIDLSGSGLTVRTPKFLEVGEVVQLRTQTTFILGEVRYCQPSADSFCAGVRIQSALVDPKVSEAIDLHSGLLDGSASAAFRRRF